MTSQSKAFYRFLRRYHHDYGGWSAIAFSPFFIVSVCISIVSYHSISNDYWVEISISAIPNLLGFSLGTYALLFSLISPRIRLALRHIKNSKGVKYFDEMNATFFHFIITQILCIIWAFLFRQTLFLDIAKFISYNFPCEFDFFPFFRYLGGFIGLSLFIYSIFLVIGSSLIVYRIAKIVDPDPT